MVYNGSIPLWHAERERERERERNSEGDTRGVLAPSFYATERIYNSNETAK